MPFPFGRRVRVLGVEFVYQVRFMVSPLGSESVVFSRGVKANPVLPEVGTGFEMIGAEL